MRDCIARPGASGSVAGARAHPRLRRPEPVRRAPGARGPAHGRRGSHAAVDRRLRRDAGRSSACPTRPATGSSRPCGWPSSSAPRRSRCRGQRDERRDPRLRPRAQRHEDRRRQARPRRAGADLVRLGRGRPGPSSGEIDVYVIRGDARTRQPATAVRGAPAAASDCAGATGTPWPSSAAVIGGRLAALPIFELAERASCSTCSASCSGRHARPRPSLVAAVAERGRVRLLLRAAVPHLRRRRTRSTS